LGGGHHYVTAELWLAKKPYRRGTLSGIGGGREGGEARQLICTKLHVVIDIGRHVRKRRADPKGRRRAAIFIARILGEIVHADESDLAIIAVEGYHGIERSAFQVCTTTHSALEFIIHVKVKREQVKVQVKPHFIPLPKRVTFAPGGGNFTATPHI